MHQTGKRPKTDKKDKSHPILGKLALKHGLITRTDLEKASAACRDADNGNHALADYFSTNNLISDLYLNRLVKASKAIELRLRDIKFGKIAMERGLLTKNLLDMALAEQKKALKEKRSRLLGDILVEAGIITSIQKNEILEEQNRLKKRTEAAFELSSPGENDVFSFHPDETEDTEVDIDQLDLASSEIVMGGMILLITKGYFTAYLSKTDAFDGDTTLDDINTILAQKEIVFGVVDRTLMEGFIKTDIFKEKPFRVARGILPTPGRDAAIRYHFSPDRLTAGRINKKGAIDFRDRGEIPQVAEGDILVEKIPAQEGVDGTTIFGDLVKVPPVKEKKLKYGKGTRVDEEALKVIAAVDGQPIISWSGAVSVMDEFTTKGDVNYETGNIEYQGNIMIRGTIQTGFRVKGNNITARQIDGGIVHAEGDLAVSGGINSAKIYAKGVVSAKYIHKSEILCMGDIHATKEIIDSTVNNSGACYIEKGIVIASTIIAKMGVFARTIGTDRSAPNAITSGPDIFVEKNLELIKEKITIRKNRIKRTEQLLTKLQERMNNLMNKGTQEHTASPSGKSNKNSSPTENSKNSFKKKQTLLSNAQIRLKKRNRRIIRSIQSQKETLELLQAEKKTLVNWRDKNPGSVIIETTGALTARTFLGGIHSEKTVTKTIRNSLVKELMVYQPGYGKSKARWELQIVSR